MNGHYEFASSIISEIPKNLTPKDFCEKTYGKASFYLASYGLQEKTKVEKFQTWCETQQATRTQRAKIPKTEWDKLVNMIIPK